MAEQKENMILNDLMRILFRRWQLFVLGALLFATAALAWAHLIPLGYTGTAKFERRRDPASERTTYRGSESFGALKLTLEYELKGFEAMAEAVEELGLTRGMPRDAQGQLTDKGQVQKQVMVLQLQEAVTVSWDVRSDQVDLISVSFTHSDPWLAEQMPNVLIENYINRVSNKVTDRLRDSFDFLKQQVDSSSRRLAEIIKQRIDFETENAGILPDSPGALQENILRIEGDLEVLRLQHDIAREKLANYEAMLTPPDPNNPEATQEHWGPNPELETLEKELFDARNALDVALNVNGMRDDHPRVQQLRLAIAQLEKRITNTPAEKKVLRVVGGVNPTSDFMRIERLAAEAEVETTARELQRLEKRLEAYQAMLGEFGPRRQRYLDIVKKIDDQQDELKRWEEALAEVDMALAAEAAKRRTHLNAVQAALKPSRPSSPDLNMVLGMALAGGLCFGAALVFLATKLDQSVSSPEQAVEELRLPVYGLVSEIKKPGQEFGRRLSNWCIKPLGFAIVLVALGVATFSFVLRLRFPDHYQMWKDAPLKYVSTQLSQADQDQP